MRNIDKNRISKQESERVEILRQIGLVDKFNMTPSLCRVYEVVH